MQQIIYLDADDDITTVRERLNRTQASRVSLVVPAKSRVFQNLVNLRLLERYASQFGVEITLVTGDPATRDLARGVRIPVRGSLAGGDAALSEPGRRGQAAAAGPGARRRQAAHAAAAGRAILGRGGAGCPARPGARRHCAGRARASSLGRLAGYLLLLALILLAGAGVVLALPEATIRLTPATATLSQIVAVRASTEYRSADLAKGQVPARLIQATVEDAAQADATGKKQEPAQRAAGNVRFTNRSGAELTVLPGTVVRTGMGTPIRFFTTVIATVPAGSFVQVPVVAEQSGSDGNVPA